MARLGQLLIGIGFLIGALVSVLNELQVPWGYFSLGLIVGVAGVALVKLGERRAALEVRATGAGIDVLERSLVAIVDSLAALDARKDEMNPYEVRHVLDEEVAQPLTEFVEARETLVHVYGLQSYADVMSRFAAAERHLNRTWSASADGYVDEVRTYIARSHEGFEESLEMLRGLSSAQ